MDPVTEMRMILYIECGENSCTEGQLAGFLFLAQSGLIKLSLVSR